LGHRNLFVVGDRVLVRAEEGESMTSAGLILPPSVADRDAVQAGRIVAIGPGLAMPPSGFTFDDDWQKSRAEPRFVAMEARPGDLAIFFRKAAVEVTVNEEKLCVVPHGAILLLLRDDAGSPGARPVA
jgi:co-chaperonin GroES (HSP10)